MRRALCSDLLSRAHARAAAARFCVAQDATTEPRACSANEPTLAAAQLRGRRLPPLWSKCHEGDTAYSVLEHLLGLDAPAWELVRNFAGISRLPSLRRSLVMIFTTLLT